MYFFFCIGSEQMDRHSWGLLDPTVETHHNCATAPIVDLRV